MKDHTNREAIVTSAVQKSIGDWWAPDVEITISTEEPISTPKAARRHYKTRLRRILISRDEFEKLYVKDKMTLVEITNKTGIKVSTLGKRQKEWDIPRPKRSAYLVGNRFGNWVVLEEVVSKTGRSMCRCQCDCGAETVVDRSNLLNGLTSSCGCRHSPNLTGLRFNRFIVLEKIACPDQKGSFWKCRCDCGQEKIISGQRLTGKNPIKSCGCLRAPTIPSGTTFGRLTVISKIRKGKFWVYLCQCTCGNSVEISGTTLKTGKTRSCGCLSLNASFTTDINIFVDTQTSFREVFQALRTSAKKRGIAFNLSLAQVGELCRQPCHYCGLVPTSAGIPDEQLGGHTYNGLDRIDSALEYSTLNVVPSCWDCNRGKSTQTTNQFLDRVMQITNPELPFVCEESPTESWTVRKHHKYKGSAKSRGKSFTLSSGQTTTIFKSPCVYCGDPGSNSYQGHSFSGLDRVDNTKGYEIPNVVPSCGWCNMSKGSGSVEAFIAWAQRVQAFQNQKVNSTT